MTLHLSAMFHRSSKCFIEIEKFEHTNNNSNKYTKEDQEWVEKLSSRYTKYNSVEKCKQATSVCRQTL